MLAIVGAGLWVMVRGIARPDASESATVPRDLRSMPLVPRLGAVLATLELARLSLETAALTVERGFWGMTFVNVGFISLITLGVAAGIRWLLAAITAMGIVAFLVNTQSPGWVFVYLAITFVMLGAIFIVRFIARLAGR